MRPHKKTTPAGRYLRSNKISTLFKVGAKAASTWVTSGCPTESATDLLAWLGRKMNTQEKVKRRYSRIRDEFKRHAGDGTDTVVLNLVFLARMLAADITRLDAVFSPPVSIRKSA